MEKKIIYIDPECGASVLEIEKMSDAEKITFAKNDNNAWIYTLEEFQEAFNAELISDLGFIYIV